MHKFATGARAWFDVLRRSAARPLTHPGYALGVVVAVIAVARVVSLPGLNHRLAWSSFDNPVFYAVRHADPTLFLNDPVGSIGREVYVYLSLTHLVPAIGLGHFGIPPEVFVYAEVFLADLFLALAVFSLAQVIVGRASVSLTASLIAVAARVTNWNLATYGYIGHMVPYAGNIALSGVVAVIALCAAGHVGPALLTAGIVGLIHPSHGVYAAAIVTTHVLISVRRPDRGLWVWALSGVALLALSVAPALYLNAAVLTKPMPPDDWWAFALQNQHFVPWNGWWAWQWFVPFARWTVLWVLSLRVLGDLRPDRRRLLMAVWLTVLVACLAGFAGVSLRSEVVTRLALFRMTETFNLAALPLVAAYVWRHMSGGTWWARAAALGCVSALAYFRQPPSLLALALLATADLADGRLSVFAFTLPTPVRRSLSAVGVVLLIGCVLAMAQWWWPTSALSRVSVFQQGLTWPATAGPGAAAAGSWLVVVGAGTLCLMMASGSSGQTKSASFRPGDPGLAVLLLFATMLARPVLIEATAVGQEQRSPPYQAWTATNLWARDHTPPSATFIGFPEGVFPQEWRTISHRNSVDLAFHGFAAYFPDQSLHDADLRGLHLLGVETTSFPSRLQISIESQQRYRALNEAEFLRIGAATNARYVLNQKPRTLQFETVYQNEFFSIYDLEKPTQEVIPHREQLPNGGFEAFSAADRPLQWSVDGLSVRRSARPSEGRAAARVSLAAGQASSGWLFTGTGARTTPPEADHYRAYPGQEYPFTFRVRGDEQCALMSFWILEFDEAGAVTETPLGTQQFLDQRYIRNPGLYTPQVAIHRAGAAARHYRFAIRVDQPASLRGCTFDVDDVAVERFERRAVTRPGVKPP